MTSTVNVYACGDTKKEAQAKKNIHRECEQFRLIVPEIICVHINIQVVYIYVQYEWVMKYIYAYIYEICVLCVCLSSS